MPRQLTEKQKRFAEGIVSGLTQEQAYIQAGYASRGVTARAEATKSIQNPNVQAYINELRKDAVDETIDGARRAYRVLIDIMEGNKDTDSLLVQKTGELVTAPPRADARVKAAVEVLKYHAGIYQAKDTTDEDDGQLDAIADGLRAAVSDD